MTDAQSALSAYERTWCQGYGSPLAAPLRDIADRPYEVPVYIQGDSYWTYVNVIESERERLRAIASELDNLS